MTAPAEHDPTQSQRLRAAASAVPLNQRIQDLESVLSITRAIAAEADLTRLLILLASSSSRVLQVERTSIWVVDAVRGGLFTKVAEGADEIRVPPGVGIVGAVAEEGESLLIPEAYADSRFNPEVDKQTGFLTREILCIPLKGMEEHRVVGVLQALNKTGGQSFSAYDVELASILAAQAGVALEAAALRESAQEQKRLQAELDLAAAIQQRLLPRTNPSIPGLQVAGTNRPATETSGDYFDYLPLAGGCWGLLVADVTGHGLGAALIMTSARAFIRGLSGGVLGPEGILSAANNLLSRDLEDGNFISMCLAGFDPQRGLLEYASAGHDPPLLYRPATDTFEELESTGPLLGIGEGMEFGRAGPWVLREGEVLAFMTDGLFECMNEADETFGKERLKEVIRKNATASAEDLLQALFAAAVAWVGGRPPRDDMTLVVVKVTAGFGAAQG